MARPDKFIEASTCVCFADTGKGQMQPRERSQTNSVSPRATMEVGNYVKGGPTVAKHGGPVILEFRC
jgi:hypothetical protein